MEFLDNLADQELLAVGRQDPYVRTHPITRERVEFVRNFVANSKYSNVPPRPEFVELHKRMRAKLLGYLEPGRALQVYKENDKSVDARYARAFAHFRRPDFTAANALIDGLIAEHPNDPYFLESKAQFKLEEGKAAEARELYARAVALRPRDSLLVQELGNAELQAGDAKAAIATLEQALRLDRDEPGAWATLARAYGADGQTGMALLAQAEAASRTGRKQEAYQFADRAARALPPNTPAALRAQDIRSANEPPKR
jgi:predicted Zn-dependent protease